MHTPGVQPNLASTLLRRAQLNPERLALIFEDQRIGYEEMAKRFDFDPRDKL